MRKKDTARSSKTEQLRRRRVRRFNKKRQLLNANIQRVLRELKRASGRYERPIAAQRLAKRLKLPIKVQRELGLLSESHLAKRILPLSALHLAMTGTSLEMLDILMGVHNEHRR